jgi:hypothetical protein
LRPRQRIRPARSAGDHRFFTPDESGQNDPPVTAWPALVIATWAIVGARPAISFESSPRSAGSAAVTSAAAFYPRRNRFEIS